MYEQIFARLDEKLPIFFALLLTYILSAYIVLPQIIRFGRIFIYRKKIPRVAHSADGLIADPVNIILIGTVQDLTNVFESIGWYKADKLTFVTAYKMTVCFLWNKTYTHAPFSSLYLFGRRQDFGFQQPIGKSPRKRNHVRFWAADIDPLAEITNFKYWSKKNFFDISKSRTWVGTASRDIGFGLTQLTYKLSHKVDKQVDNEREYILNALRESGKITDEGYVHVGELIAGKYVSDGKILWAKIVPTVSIENFNKV